MKILFITPYFPPEVGAAQARIYELASRLKGLGHDVSVLTTFPNYPTGVVPPGWRRKFYWKGSEGDLLTYRIWSYATPNRGFLRRIISHLSFAFFATLAALSLPRYDVAIVESPPLFDGFTGLFLRMLREIPYVFMVSDLWPESAIQMGVLKNRFLIKASRAIELLFYRRSSGVLALTAGIHEAVVKNGIESERVVLFRNSVDCDFFQPAAVPNPIRREIGIRDHESVVLYAGTLGLAQNLLTVLDAAFLLKETDGPQVRFLLVGAGAESDRLKERAKELELNNVMILDPIERCRMPELINASDSVLVPLRDLEIFRGALPTKMFEAMACAKPVILAIRGEAEVLIRDANAGLCVRPESASEFRDAVLSLAKDPGLGRSLGANGRNYILKHFSRNVRSREMSEALQRLVNPELAANSSRWTGEQEATQPRDVDTPRDEPQVSELL